MQEKKRWREIQFYYYILNLLEQYDRSAFIYDIVESLSQLFDCNTLVIRGLLNDINTGQSILEPSREEMIVLSKRNGVSIRRLRRMTRIHPQTYYNVMNNTELALTKYVGVLDDSRWMEINSFLDGVEQFNKVKTF